MRKLLLLFVVALISFTSQAQYKNVQVNEKVHYNEDSLTSCYVVVEKINVGEVGELQAVYKLATYKSKAVYQLDRNYNIAIKEIPVIIPLRFGSGEVEGDDIFAILMEELKLKLLELNPTWEAKNIVIE